MSENERTYSVTMMRAGRGLPTFEIDAYRYTGTWLPSVGDLIMIAPVAATDPEAPTTVLAYVTRIEPASDTPIRVMEATGVTTGTADDYIVAA
jgi:hypothetical protein